MHVHSDEDLPIRTPVRMERTQTGSFFPSLIVKAIAVPIPANRLKNHEFPVKKRQKSLSPPSSPWKRPGFAGLLLPAPCRAILCRSFLEGKSRAQQISGDTFCVTRTLFVCRQSVSQCARLCHARAIAVDARFQPAAIRTGGSDRGGSASASGLLFLRRDFSRRPSGR